MLEFGLITAALVLVGSIFLWRLILAVHFALTPTAPSPAGGACVTHPLTIRALNFCTTWRPGVWMLGYVALAVIVQLLVHLPALIDTNLTVTWQGDLVPDAPTVTAFGGKVTISLPSEYVVPAAQSGGEQARVLRLRTEPPFWAVFDRIGEATRSSTTVSVDGQPLLFGHAPHQTIRAGATDAFSHWGNDDYPHDSTVYLWAGHFVDGQRVTVTAPFRLLPVFHRIANLFTLPALAMLVIVVMGLWTRSMPRVVGAVRGSPIASGVLLVLFVLLAISPLFRMWLSANDLLNLSIGGYLPRTDAFGWYDAALHLLGQDEFSSWAIRRPLNVVFHATLRWITGGGLQQLLLARTLIFAVIALVYFHQLAKHVGAVPAALATSLVLASAQFWSPLMMTEALGLLLGTYTVVALLLAGDRKSLLWYCTGVLAFTTSQLVRPGPLLALPALVLVPWIVFWPDLRLAMRWMAGAVAAVVLGFGITSFWISQYGDSSNVPLSNGSYVLYGLAHGGQQWQKFFEDFPAANEMSEKESAKLATREAIKAIVTSPMDLGRGIARFTGNFFANRLYLLQPSLRWPITALWVLGFIAVLRSRRNPALAFTGAIAFAALASAPLMFWHVDAVRTLVGSEPAEIAVVAYGAALLIRSGPRVSASAEWPFMSDGALRRLAGGTGVLLLGIFTIVGVVAVERSYRIADELALDCEYPRVGGVVDPAGSDPHLSIVADDYNGWIVTPRISQSRFLSNPYFTSIENGDLLRKLVPGQTLGLVTRDWPGPDNRADIRYFILDSNLIPTSGARLEICGDVIRDPDGTGALMVTESRVIPR